MTTRVVVVWDERAFRAAPPFPIDPKLKRLMNRLGKTGRLITAHVPRAPQFITAGRAAALVRSIAALHNNNNHDRNNLLHQQHSTPETSQDIPPRGHHWGTVSPLCSELSAWSMRCARLGSQGRLFTDTLSGAASSEGAVRVLGTVDFLRSCTAGAAGTAKGTASGVLILSAWHSDSISLERAVTWSRCLLTLLVRRIRIYSAQAIISTLGGAWFQSSDYPRALRYARGLLRVGKALHHDRMQMQARLYIAYNKMMLGDHGTAEKSMKRQYRLAEERGDAEILAMGRACLHRLGLERTRLAQSAR